MPKEAKSKKLPPKQAKEIREKVEPITRHVLSAKLEVWEVPIALPIEQSMNARAMNPEMFMQLTANIANRGALESLPLCALTDVGLEVVSGHHRLRAARKAELATIWVLVDVSGLSKDRIRSKQLSHNSIQGEDNPDLLAQIYSLIADADARIEAYINLDELKESDYAVKLTTAEFELELETKTISLIFLPLQAKLFSEAIQKLKDMETDEVVLATIDEYDTLISIMDVVSDKFKIQSAPTILAKMAEIVMEHVGKDDGTDNEG